jgi:hypothetical protein
VADQQFGITLPTQLGDHLVRQLPPVTLEPNDQFRPDTLEGSYRIVVVETNACRQQRAKVFGQAAGQFLQPAADPATAPWRSTPEGRLGESRIDLYRFIEDEQPFELFLMEARQPLDQGFHGRVQQHCRLGFLDKWPQGIRLPHVVHAL